MSGTAKSKETWFKPVRQHTLCTLGPSFSKFFDAQQTLPEWANQGWVSEIGIRLEASVLKALNLKNDDEISPAILGVLCAQAENCSVMKFTPLLKREKISAKTRAGLVRVIDYVSPAQQALGKLARKIRSVMNRQPCEVWIAFSNAYSLAAEKKMYQKSNDIFWETPATRLYITLIRLAPWMHQVNSVRHLHSILFPKLGAVVGRDPKRLEKICQRIGLTFRKPGRPVGS